MPHPNNHRYAQPRYVHPCNDHARAALGLTSLIWIVAVALAALLGVFMAAGSLSRDEGSQLRTTNEAIDRPFVSLPDRAGLKNLFQLGDEIYSGSAPSTAKSFAVLASLGIRTIISVDGGRPDLSAASARGFRYVHIPLGYDGINEGEGLLLAKALLELERPIYVHCHHGKHRGPAAVATALVMLDEFSMKAAQDFLTVAGTSLHYDGLLASVHQSTPVDKAMLRAKSVTFSSAVDPPDFLESMVLVSDAYHNLTLIKDADWRSPADHPDLDALAEASRLADLFRDLAANEADGKGWMGANDGALSLPGREAFVDWLHESSRVSLALEEQLREGEKESLAATLMALSVSCQQCHTRFRN